MQLTKLFSEFDRLQSIYGSKKLRAIYGAGKIDKPNVCLIFMNPTARNISSVDAWKGIRAPWLGTKHVWKLLYKLRLFKNSEMLNIIQHIRPHEWTPNFAKKLYEEMVKESLYITNVAKCTQNDAKSLPNSVFKIYLPLMIEELKCIKPRIVITFGNQVSSVLLGKQISVSKYMNNEYEILSSSKINFKVYPSYYPVGQGMRNVSKTIKRVKSIIDT